MTTRALSLLLVGLMACGGSERHADAEPAEEEGMVSSGSSDSLALRTPGDQEIWFVGSRPAADSAGTVCVERTMQIREGDRKINIPLLYTGSAPRLVNDSTIEAAIWLHCRPGNLYQVNLRTGQPVRVR